MNLSVRLNKNFTTQYNKMQSEYGEEFARLNGFADEQLSYTDFIDNFIDEETVADFSVDGSSNVGNKDMRTLMNEMPKPHRKLLAFNKIYYELNKKYGFKTANEWLAAEWTKLLYLHDGDTSSYIHYCFAYDLKDLAEKGLYFLDNFNSEPPQHLSTFVDFVKEFISFASNRSSGAVGLPNIIPYMYYFWKKDCASGHATKSPEYYAKQQIQRFVYAVNQPYVRDGIQSAFTNVSVYDQDYLEALFGGSTFPDGSFMIDELEGIKEFQKVFMEEVSEIRSRNMFTFPVLSISLLRKDGKFADEDFARWAVKHNMTWADSNFFIDDSVSSLSNCCRLKSDIKDLYFNSIGGTALKVGSVKVSTINLARLALTNDTEEGYLSALRDTVELDCKVLDVVRHILRRNVEKGLLPNFSKGLVDFEHLYNTIGVIGVYEAIKSFGYVEEDNFGNSYYTKEADEFGRKIFEVIHNVKDEFMKDKDYKINLEQVPGETAAMKMLKADKMLFPETVVADLPLYGNQFIPLGIKTTLQERIRIASLFDSYCNGGSIAHINIEAPFTNFEQAWSLTEYIADQGLTYFAFNVRIQACKHNHAFFGTKCPTCGGDVVTEYTRIVGFYVPISTWSKERKAEYALREWESDYGN
jgi:ribonucleoside-triphosphate reductase